VVILNTRAVRLRRRSWRFLQTDTIGLRPVDVTYTPPWEWHWHVTDDGYLGQAQPVTQEEN